MASSLSSLLLTPPSPPLPLPLFRTPPSCLFSSSASTNISLHHYPAFLSSQLPPLTASLAPAQRHQTKTLPKGMVRQPKIASCLLDIEIGRELAGRVLLGLFKKVPKTSKNFCAMCTADNSKLLRSNDDEKQQAIIWPQFMLWAAVAGFPILTNFPETAYASSNGGPNLVYNEISAVLEFGVQLLYLGALLALLGIGSFLVVRQILIRRELETAAKDLQDRVRAGEATSVEYFELGAVMLRKKFFSLATKYLEQAIQKWDGDAQDLAQVYNALGFSYLSDGKVDKAIIQYEKAVKLQPGYVVAWNNLGDAYEKKKDLPSALKAYEQALLFDPNNRVARTCRDSLKDRVDRLKGVPIKYD